MSGWDSVLDEMERRIADVDLVLFEGAPAPASFEVPEGLGPLPPRLHGRAERVYALTVDAEMRVEQAQSALLAATRRTEVPAAPAYVDRRA